MKKVKKVDPSKESPDARKARVLAQGNRFSTKIVADKKNTYSRQRFKKGDPDE